MIHTIIIVICTAVNTMWGIYWFIDLNNKYKAMKRIQHFELCSSSIKHGICPHNCKVCAWGDFMTEKQLNQEKKVRKFWKKIIE